MRRIVDQRDGAVLCELVDTLEDPAVASEAFDWAAAGADASKPLSLVVLDDEAQRLAVGRPARLQNVAVEAGGQNARLASRRRDHGKVTRAVSEQLDRAALEIGDAAAVGTPCRIARIIGIVVGSGEGGELRRSLGRTGSGHDPQVVIVR